MRIGLALGGAVSRGFAHIGVLMALEREGMPIDVISGTSAGAIVGALYAAGQTPAQMQDLIAHLSWFNIAGLVWPREGFASFAKLERWLAQIIGDVSFSQLKMPFAAVATDLEEGDPVQLTEGRVVRAVHASCAVPGVIVPVRIDGKILCDGGVSANIPVQAARDLGADYVIGVDLFAHSVRRGWGPFGFAFAGLEILVRNSGSGRAHADYLITPELAGSLYVPMGGFEERIRLGMEATEAALAAIREDIALREATA
ncbi:MAG: patatin-like phospholipase family protein, partial [Rudaea sp.]